jgi:hypothetical protein
LNNHVNLSRFIGPIGRRNFPAIGRRTAMFLFNRSVLAVCFALLVAGLPVIAQLFA